MQTTVKKTYDKRPKKTRSTVSIVISTDVYKDARDRFLLSQICEDAIATVLRDYYTANGCDIPAYLVEKV